MIKPWGHLHRRVFLHLYLRMIWLTLCISSLLSFNFTHAKYHRTQKESVFWICCSYWTGFATPCTWCAFWVVYRVKACTLSDTIFTYYIIFYPLPKQMHSQANIFTTEGAGVPAACCAKGAPPSTRTGSSLRSPWYEKNKQKQNNKKS